MPHNLRLIPAGKGWVQVVDVESKFVVSGQYRTQWGVVRPLRADAVVKSLGWPWSSMSA